DRLRGDDVIERTALEAGEDRCVDLFRVLGLADDRPAPWPAQGLVRGEGDDVRDADRARVHATGDEACRMCRVEEEVRADLIGDLPERHRVNDPGVRGRPGDDEPGSFTV